MSIQARLFKFLIDMDRITINEVPLPYKDEISGIDNEAN